MLVTRPDDIDKFIFTQSQSATSDVRARVLGLAGRRPASALDRRGCARTPPLLLAALIIILHVIFPL